MHVDPTDINSSLISPLQPHIIVLFGATGDLARRKLVPGLIHLSGAGLLPEFRIVGVSLDDLDDDGFRAFARAALDEFAHHGVSDDTWQAFASRLSYACESAGIDALVKAIGEAEDELGENVARLHYLSIPPAAAPEVVHVRTHVADNLTSTLLAGQASGSPPR
jgi:glucose-6-phosphate 1-dehydrogenase